MRAFSQILKRHSNSVIYVFTMQTVEMDGNERDLTNGLMRQTGPILKIISFFSFFFLCAWVPTKPEVRLTFVTKVF